MQLELRECGVVGDVPSHRNEHTGNPVIDRIQGNVRDLIAFVRRLGERVTALESGKFLALAVDKTNTGAGAYVDLMSTTYVSAKASSFLLLTLMASFVKATAAGGVYFTILVDGAQVGDSTYLTVPLNSAGNCCLMVRHPVVAGTHTIKVQWAGSPNSVVCRPATNLNEFCSLYIQEVA